jgi:hypothetical protein
MAYHILYKDHDPEDNPQLFVSLDELQVFIEGEYNCGEDMENYKVATFDESLSMKVKVQTVFKLEPPF